MTRRILVGVFALVVGLVVPVMAANPACCVPGAACCRSTCCN